MTRNLAEYKIFICVPRAVSHSKLKIAKIHISLIYNIYYTRACHTQKKTLMQIPKVPWLRTKKKRVQSSLCRAETRIIISPVSSLGRPLIDLRGFTQPCKAYFSSKRPIPRASTPKASAIFSISRSASKGKKRAPSFMSLLIFWCTMGSVSAL